jgi:PIN domain nuclease of toxin-antitoxin system
VRVLLDTHVVLWALRDPDRLSDAAQSILVDGGVELVVSAVVPWEVATKHRLGKLDTAGSLVAAFDDHLARLGTTTLPITARHALLAGGLDRAHRDPFDRMLAAQSVIEGLPLVTDDRAFDTILGVATLW